MLPDYELYKCRQLFASNLTHESLFGLGRLAAFEGKFHKALEFLKSAISMHRDPVYCNWHTILSVKVANSVDKPVPEASFFRKLWCFSLTLKEPSLLEKIWDMQESVEKDWSLMELSMKMPLEIDPPQHFASKIKEKDLYYGYLAWAEVVLRRNEWQVGLDILKELIRNYRNQPEAYVRLWQHYYHTVKDYEQAEDIAAEGVLKVNSPDFHQFYILLCVYLCKTLFKLKKQRESLDTLLRKFIENPTYPVFIFYYGKFCSKSEDFMFNGSAIGALHESIRLCDTSKFGIIYYWLAKAYMQGRQYLDAYEIIQLAIKHLENTHSRKVLELKRWMNDIQESVQKIHIVEDLLNQDKSRLIFTQCKNTLNEVKGLHKLAVDVLNAKLLWKKGKHERALKKLYSVSGISTVKMNAYFLLLDYLGQQGNFKCMKTVASEMIMKCRNFKVPSHIWVKANLIYAKVLTKNGKPGKAIMALKCLAKVLPPIPFVDIRYTKLLQRANSIQDMSSASSCSIESFNAYNYSAYKNSFIYNPYNMREFSQQLIIEEAAPIPDASSKMQEFRKSQRTITESLTPRRFTKRRTVEVKEVEETKELTILGVPIPNLMEFKGFSICSDFTFLYKIARISEKYNIYVQDGICAIKDFLELIKFEKDIFFREKFRSKAKKIQEKLSRMSA